MEIRKELALELRCIKDARCYLAYTNEKKSWRGETNFWCFLDKLDTPYTCNISLLNDTIDWRSSIKGTEYWHEKWCEVGNVYKKNLVRLQMNYNGTK